MANTDITQALPIQERKGAVLETTIATWSYSPWVLLDDSVKTDIAIQGLTFMTQAIPAVDVTNEALFEIGVGDRGNPVMKIQIPTSQRSDTAVGIYLPPKNVFLPEPYTVTAGNAIYIRVACSVRCQSFNGVRLLVQAADRTPISPPNIKSTNYQFVSVPNGISSSGRLM